MKYTVEPTRAQLIYGAKVYLAEARRRRKNARFHATLLTWAANTRRRIAALDSEKPKQADLFGSAA